MGGDPLHIVQPLLGQPGAFLAFDEDRWFFGCRPLESSGSIDPEPRLGSRPGRSPFPRWFGLLPYEAFRGAERAAQTDRRSAPLCERVVWQRYGAVLVCDGEGARIEGDDAAAMAELDGLLRAAPHGPSSLHGVRMDLVEPVEAPKIHRRRIEQALERIARGDLYQVNLARRFDFRVSGHPIELLMALGPEARASFASAGDFGGTGWVSMSPELFLSLDAEGKLVTRPIKGTRPRGPTAEEDERLRQELEGSEKERAELAMVIDVERNDLGRVSETGSVKLVEAPRVTSHSTVHHREATILSKLRVDVSRAELLAATMPSGSVTGAPKLRAMELAAELEAERRGLYTGAIGWLGHDGSLRLSMAIRTLTMQGGRGHYFAGGGIVADSDPEREVEETLWKARQLRLLAPQFGKVALT